jgi:hypothetical protein
LAIQVCSAGLSIHVSTRRSAYRACRSDGISLLQCGRRFISILLCGKTSHYDVCDGV